MSYRVTLPGGIRVVGEEIASMRSVSIGLWIGTGSRYESVQNNGISHFIEHMLFKGTERFSARQLAEVFDSIGGQVNAFTSKEYTCYYAKVLDEHFEIAVDALSDMLYHSRFAPEEIEKEKKVVIEEIRMYEDTPDELVMDVLAENVYGTHPLGFTILGPEDNLSAFTRNDITNYLEARYTPSNLVISIAGNVTQEKALEMIMRYFSESLSSSRVEQNILTPKFNAVHSQKYKDTEQVHICLASPGLKAGDDDLYALVLLNNALGNSPSSRLFQEIREERGLAYSVFSFHSAYLDSGMFGIYAGASPNYMSDVLPLVKDIVDDVSVKGLTEDELRKGKEQLKGSMMLSLESTSSRMSRLGKNELVLGREVTLDETLAGINKVTTEDVRRVARQVLQQKFAIAAVGPIKDMDFAPFV